LLGLLRDAFLELALVDALGLCLAAVLAPALGFCVALDSVGACRPWPMAAKLKQASSMASSKRPAAFVGPQAGMNPVLT
jgi:hypothetical protein